MDISLEKLEDAVALAAEIERLEKRLKALFEPTQPLIDVSLEKLQQAVTLVRTIKAREKQLQALFKPPRKTSAAHPSIPHKKLSSIRKRLGRKDKHGRAR